MNERRSPSEARGARVSQAGRTPRGRTDRAISLPLIRVFYPGPDPTEGHPQKSAAIEGYLVAPDRTITIAATWSVPEGLDMIDSVWSALQWKGVASHRMLLLDDRGRAVSVMALKPMMPQDLMDLLRALLVVPIRISDGFAEVHLFATAEEFDALVGQISGDEKPVPAPTTVFLPAAKDTGILQPEDWAFLGLLSCVGAFDGPEGPSPELIAKLLNLEPEAFADRAVAIEDGLSSLVSDVFARPAEIGEGIEKATT